MIKKEVVYKIIAENENAINSNDFNVLYDELGINLDFEDADSAGYFTKMLLDVGVDPLEYLNYMPGGYFCGLPIKSFIVPKHIVEIFDGAFKDCTQLESIVMHNDIKTLGASCFENCRELKEVVIPKNIIEISPALFYNCTRLNKLTMNNHLEYLEDYAFSNTALKEINLIDCKRVNLGAFEDTPNLRTLTISKNTALINSRIDDSSLEKIVYDGTIEKFDSLLFTNSLCSKRKISVICKNGEIYR